MDRRYFKERNMQRRLIVKLATASEGAGTRLSAEVIVGQTLGLSAAGGGARRIIKEGTRFPQFNRD